MLVTYERHRFTFYLMNAASGLHHRDREASALAEWVTIRESRTRAAAGGSGPVCFQGPL